MIHFARRVLNGIYWRLNEYFFLPVLGWVPRVVYGNNAGFLNNILSPIELSRFKKSWTPILFSTEEVSHYKALQDQGMVTLGYPHPMNLTQTIYEKIQALMQTPSAVLEQGHPPHQKAHILIKNPVVAIPEIHSLLTPAIIKELQGYYGSYFKVATVRCWRNHHVPGINTESNVFSNQWHNDQFNTNVVKYFVYFTNGITSENGAFRAHPISATTRIMRSFGFFRRSHIYGKAKQLIDSSETVKCMEGNIGFSFICNPTLCLHRAGIPAVGKFRDIVQFTFLPSDKPLTSTWDKEFPKEDLHYL